MRRRFAAVAAAVVAVLLGLVAVLFALARSMEFQGTCGTGKSGKVVTRVLHVMVMLSGSFLLAGCHGARPATIGARDGRLAPCPSSPNCVSSLAEDDVHRVAPFPFTGTAGAAIGRLTGIVRSLPRASVITSTETYLHVEFTSAVFRFIDDVEFLADESTGAIQVRSASRVGFSDLGVNRRRVEAVRARWRASPTR